VVRDNFADLLPAIDKMVAVSDVSGALDAVEAEVRSAAGHAVTILRSQPYYLDVTHTQANKGDGVIALADLIGVPLSATAAIGDMDNDLPMFAQAGLSIAMGQAPDAVKAAADHVTTSNEEDGVAHAIETYILPAIAKG
jgi:hydroxymethylpyrimidine pyrophosphatase-like HAD family hydrolase